MHEPQSPRPIEAVPLGDSGYAVLGAGTSVRIDSETNEVVVEIVLAGGKLSPLVGLRGAQVRVVELKRIPAVDVVAMLAAKLGEHPADAGTAS